MKIGFLVNPVAGMGGAVGLKGTDGQIEEALRRGAVPRSAHRAEETLALLCSDEILWCTCSGPMGEASLRIAGITGYTVLYHPATECTAEDTRSACRAFCEEGVDLIVFCGGDGTARDVYDVVGKDVPILGIPAGVKMYSAVFATSPASAADLIRGSSAAGCRDSEVMDIDEEAYRCGTLSSRLYGYARVPYLPERIQAGKQVMEEADEGRAQAEIARFIAEILMEDTLYIFGAGSTTAAIFRHVGLEKTLLGVDVIKGGRIVARDVDERTLLELLDTYGRAKIVISPIGAQGCILGRGNQQISPAVVRKAGTGNLIVVATPGKLAHTPSLFMDSGDAVLDESFGDSVAVISGYRIAQRRRLLRT